MRVLIVNTSERTGGAAIAANRLMEALINNGVKAKMLVRDKTTDNPSVVALSKGWKGKFHFILERFVILLANKLHKHRLFEVDAAKTGTGITRYKEFKEADVIHIHWINQGMLSLKGINDIINSGKPIVWTMHDMWPFTGICHYNGTCENYRTFCHKCPVLYGGGSSRDLSFTTFKKKIKILKASNIAFVACSSWLAQTAQNSYILSEHDVKSIPNAINTSLYRPLDKNEARLRCNLPKDKSLILFTAYNTKSTIKGIALLEEACRILDEQNPQMKEKLGIIAVGKESEMLSERFPFPVYGMNYVKEELKMVDLYNSATVFAIPSLQDNLPNTIVEAMACGIPCVGFNTGGIPQMIEHHNNGYVAKYKDAADFAEGLLWSLTHPDGRKLSEAVCKKARTTYSEHTVAKQYIDLYNKITNSENG